MEETNKEEVKFENVKEKKHKGGKRAKLGPAATVMLTIAATLGIIVLIAVVYAIFQVL